jgi:multiple sugar transport system permease protein/sn-glycerol 3-phosphate transport system permease protein
MSTTARERLTFAAFVAPNLLLLAVFTYWPLLQNLYLSFVDWDMISPDKPWVGLDNWRLVLRDPSFWRITFNTVAFAALTVTATLCLGLGAALLLNNRLRGRAGARTVIFSPVVLPGAAIALVWIYMFDPNWGLLKVLLGFAGVRSPAWLTDPVWALPAVAIVAIWKGLGYSTVIFLAGLQGIPRELYEAARVDGAGAWGRFQAVTLPGLGPVSFFLPVTSLLAAFQAFDVIKVMTNGGPVIATTTLVFAMYQQGFTAFHAGRAAVYAIVLFGALLALTAAQLRVGERRVTYG